MDDSDEHGIEIDSADYFRTTDGAYRPVLRCMCGFHTSHDNIEWEQAGAEFDKHLSLHARRKIEREKEK